MGQKSLFCRATTSVDYAIIKRQVQLFGRIGAVSGKHRKLCNIYALAERLLRLLVAPRDPLNLVAAFLSSLQRSGNHKAWRITVISSITTFSLRQNGLPAMCTAAMRPGFCPEISTDAPTGVDVSKCDAFCSLFCHPAYRPKDTHYIDSSGVLLEGAVGSVEAFLAIQQ